MDELVYGKVEQAQIPEHILLGTQECFEGQHLVLHALYPESLFLFGQLLFRSLSPQQHGQPDSDAVDGPAVHIEHGGLLEVGSQHARRPVLVNDVVADRHSFSKGDLTVDEVRQVEQRPLFDVFLFVGYPLNSGLEELVLVGHLEKLEQKSRNLRSPSQGVIAYSDLAGN